MPVNTFNPHFSAAEADAFAKDLGGKAVVIDVALGAVDLVNTHQGNANAATDVQVKGDLKVVAKTSGGIAGAAIGGAAAGLVAGVVCGPGIVICGPVFAIVGAIAGSVGGQALFSDIADYFSGGEFHDDFWNGIEYIKTHPGDMAWRLIMSGF